MGKAIGAILTILGVFISLFLVFIYMNSNAVLHYNPDTPLSSVSSSGVLMPSIIAIFMTIIGIFLLVAPTGGKQELQD